MRSWARHFGVAVAFGLLFGAAGRAGAGPLDPNAFTSLGAFPGATGTYTLDTSGTPTLSGPGGTFTGVVSNGVAVFDFSAINVGAGENITATGALPLALLSQGGITISGTVDVSGGRGGPGGPGGGAGGSFLVGSTGSTPGGGPGGGGASNLGGNMGGGGGFGGVGGSAGQSPGLPPSPPVA